MASKASRDAAITDAMRLVGRDYGQNLRDAVTKSRDTVEVSAEDVRILLAAARGARWHDDPRLRVVMQRLAAAAGR